MDSLLILLKRPCSWSDFFLCFTFEKRMNFKGGKSRAILKRENLGEKKKECKYITESKRWDMKISMAWLPGTVSWREPPYFLSISQKWCNSMLKTYVLLLAGARAPCITSRKLLALYACGKCHSQVKMHKKWVILEDAKAIFFHLSYPQQHVQCLYAPTPRRNPW